MRAARWWMLIGLGLLVLGCNRVTLENYHRIQPGMSEAAVRDILGGNAEVEGGGLSIGDVELSGKVMRWGGNDKHITVTFVNGEVKLKTQRGL